MFLHPGQHPSGNLHADGQTYSQGHILCHCACMHMLRS